MRIVNTMDNIKNFGGNIVSGDKNNREKKRGKSKATLSDFETFPIAHGKKDPKSGSVIPAEESVLDLKSFVEQNKK